MKLLARTTIILVVLLHCFSFKFIDNLYAQNEGSTALSESSDEIDSQVEDLQQRRASPIPLGPLDFLFEAWDDSWNWVDKNYGLSMGFAYTTVIQAATESLKNADKSGGSGDLDIFGRWKYLESGKSSGLIGEGLIGFNAEYRHRMGAVTPANLGSNIGSLWGTVSGFNDQPFSLVQWWWQQFLLEDKFAFRIGKLDLVSLFDVYRYNSANHFYFNAAFSDNPVIPFPGNGLGLAVQVIPSESLFLIAGTGDAEGRKTETSVSSLEDIDAWFNIATFGWNNELADLGKGLYQITIWHSEQSSSSDRPSGSGFSLVAQQELPNQWVPFTRYAWSSDPVTNTEKLLTIGAVHEAPFGQMDDRFGIAIGWGHPHNSDDLRDQFVFEAFYRSYLIGRLIVTPNLQVIMNPSRNPEDDFIGVLGVRFRVTF